MTESYAKRYLKRCEEFILCAELGGKDFIGIERSKFRYTLYQYFIHGSASFYELSDDGIVSRTIGKEKQLVDVKKYFNKNTILQAHDDFYVAGFSPLDKNDDWDGKIIKESFHGNDYSWLICFGGNPIVNGKELKLFDYAKLRDKEYDVNLNGGVIVMFTKL